MGDYFNMNFGSGQQPDCYRDPAAGGSDSRAVSLRGRSIAIDEIWRERVKIQMEGYQWMAAIQDLFFKKQMMMQQKLMTLQKLEQGVLDSSDTSLLKFPPPQGKVINWLETSPDWKENDTFQRMGKL